MSAGAFVLSKYEANNGDIYPIRLQPESLDLEIATVSNDEPAGAVDQPTRAKVSRARGAIGIRPRKVSIRFTDPAPTGYKADQSYTIPVLQASLWDSAIAGTVASYLGVAAVVISRSPEDIR